MKNLVYTIAVGEYYVKIFEYFYKSLIMTNDQNNYDIWLFTDQKTLDYIQKNFKFDSVQIKLCSAHQYVLPKFNNVKFEIFKHLPVDKYDNVLYADADIIFNGDISKLFLNLHNENIQAETFKNYKEGDDVDFWSFYRPLCLNEKDFLSRRDYPLYGAGAFSFKANSKIIKDKFQQCLSIFDDVPNMDSLNIAKNKQFKKGTHTVIDQGVFQIVLSLNGEIQNDKKILQPFEGAIVKSAPYNESFDHVILHFVHPQKDKRIPVSDKLKAMEFLYKKINNLH
jgi:lipopolysaccharide biosynthesis glycosyltransferase